MKTNSPSPSLATLNAGMPGRSPEGTAIARALSPDNIARRAGLGAARRSSRNHARQY
jgi:hypothetical protein